MASKVFASDVIWVNSARLCSCPIVAKSNRYLFDYFPLVSLEFKDYAQSLLVFLIANSAQSYGLCHYHWNQWLLWNPRRFHYLVDWSILLVMMKLDCFKYFSPGCQKYFSLIMVDISTSQNVMILGASYYPLAVTSIYWLKELREVAFLENLGFDASQVSSFWEENFYW